MCSEFVIKVCTVEKSNFFVSSWVAKRVWSEIATQISLVSLHFAYRGNSPPGCPSLSSFSTLTLVMETPASHPPPCKATYISPVFLQSGYRDSSPPTPPTPGAQPPLSMQFLYAHPGHGDISPSGVSVGVEGWVVMRLSGMSPGCRATHVSPSSSTKVSTAV